MQESGVSTTEWVALTVAAASVLVALMAVVVALRANRLARHANALPTLVELFREYRNDRLSSTRRQIWWSADQWEPGDGLDGIPGNERQKVRELLWFLDNLGALVTHDIVAIGPVSGYLGGSALNMWERLEPFILSERQKLENPEWQLYFQNLAALIRETPPSRARQGPWWWQHKKWRL